MTRRQAPAEITLRALVTARWVLLALLGLGAALVVLVPGAMQQWLPQAPTPVAFFSVLAVWLLANLITARWILAAGRASERAAGLHLLIDAAVLTVLLGLSGGPTNPFTTVYFVPITLATQVSPRWTWALAGTCLLGFASLFLLEPLPAEPAVGNPSQGHGHEGHGGHFAGHLRGMWIAFGISGALITYFVHRIALSLSRQRKELAHLREQALQDRQLAAVGTLAAGAAHELGTPLGSIALLIGDLDRMTEDERVEAVDTVREQLRRCKDIVHRMASPQLGVQQMGVEGLEPWPAPQLAEPVRQVAAAADVELVVSIDEVEIAFPRPALEQIVRELVTNAVDACRRRDDRAGTIRVAIEAQGAEVKIEVRDDGVGMTQQALAHAFDPFFSTKAEGEGTGLGLFLARAQLRQLGGRLSLDSTLGHGTTLRLWVPGGKTEGAHGTHDPAGR